MKADIREKYKILRSGLNDHEIDKKSAKIFKLLLDYFDLEDKNISVFLPIKKFKEVNTWYLIDHVKANFYLPVVQNKHLKHVLFENKKQLKPSNWGIDEPTYGQTVNPNVFDVVIVPLLAFDKTGHRVGYGAGFYDGFLKDCQPNCKFVGVSFFEPLETNIQTYDTDIPLHAVVTPKEVYLF